MKKKLLIFDADGTIWDSEKDVYLSFNYILSNNVGTKVDEEKFRELAGLPMEIMFEKVLPNSRKGLSNEFTRMFRKYYIDEEHCMDTTKLFENVKSTIDFFKEKGFKMAIASGKPNRILEKMIIHFGLERFDLILGTGESKFKHKPNPEIINYIIDTLKMEKEDAVMIGDCKTDVLCGKNADIDTIAVTYGYDTIQNILSLQPTYQIDNFKELLNIVEMKE